MASRPKSNTALAQWMEAHPRVQRVWAWSVFGVIMVGFFAVVWHAARTNSLYLFGAAAAGWAVRRGITKKVPGDGSPDV